MASKFSIYYQHAITRLTLSAALYHRMFVCQCPDLLDLILADETTSAQLHPSKPTRDVLDPVTSTDWFQSRMFSPRLSPFTSTSLLTLSQFTTNLLTIPATVIGCFTLLGLTWISVRVNERALVAMIQNCWTLPCIIALRAWSGAGTKAHAWPTFSLLTVLLSYPYCHAIVTYVSSPHLC